MIEQDLQGYIDDLGGELTLSEAWQDFADAYGWDREDNPYA